MTSREKFIALVDHDCIRVSDVIILLEGDGLNRYSKAVELFKNGFAERIIFSGGITDYAYGSFPFSEVSSHLIGSGIPADLLLHESKSMNTREQALEVIRIAIANQWTRLILVASQDHQYRAYLTFLREIIDNARHIHLYNAPAKNLHWFSETGWGQRIQRLEIEFEKIDDYSKIGHLATFEEAIEYQKWKEKQE